MSWVTSAADWVSPSFSSPTTSRSFATSPTEWPSCTWVASPRWATQKRSTTPPPTRTHTPSSPQPPPRPAHHRPPRSPRPPPTAPHPPRRATLSRQPAHRVPVQPALLDRDARVSNRGAAPALLRGNGCCSGGCLVPSRRRRGGCEVIPLTRGVLPIEHPHCSNVDSTVLSVSSGYTVAPRGVRALTGWPTPTASATDTEQTHPQKQEPVLNPLPSQLQHYSCSRGYSRLPRPEQTSPRSITPAHGTTTGGEQQDDLSGASRDVVVTPRARTQGVRQTRHPW